MVFDRERPGTRLQSELWRRPFVERKLCPNLKILILCYGNYLLYMTIHAMQSANAEKFTHGEEHLKLIAPKVFHITQLFWKSSLLCLDNIFQPFGPVNIFRLFALREIERTHFEDHIHHGDVCTVYITLVFFQVTKPRNMFDRPGPAKLSVPVVH